MGMTAKHVVKTGKLLPNACIFIFLIHSCCTVPSSAPLDVAVDDVNDTSLTIKWKTPENVGSSGLSGYTVEYRKDGSKCIKSVCVYV